MPKIGHIIRGWGMRFGIIPTTSAEAKLRDLRLKKCAECDFAKPKNILRILNGNVSNEAELQCTKCTCPCWEKAIIVDEKCPENFW